VCTLAIEADETRTEKNRIKKYFLMSGFVIQTCLPNTGVETNQAFWTADLPIACAMEESRFRTFDRKMSERRMRGKATLEEEDLSAKDRL